MFPNLINLDLSYNRLTGDDILALGLLESLRTLHLTGMNCDCVNIIIKKLCQNRLHVFDSMVN